MKIKIKKILQTKELQKKDGSGTFPISQILTEDDEVGDVFGKPEVGDELEGDWKDTKYGKQFEKASSGKKGGFSGRSEEERTEIIRQNALGHAIKTFEISKTPLEKEKVVALAEFYKNYVQKGVTNGIKEAVKKTEKTHKITDEEAEQDLDEQDLDEILNGFDQEEDKK
jgi:hypothetical protein